MTKGKEPEKEGIPLPITMEDLDGRNRAQFKALERGDQLLDEDVDKAEILAKALPAAIIKKIEKTIPDGYKLGSIDLEFKLGGNLIGGSVRVSLVPR